MFVIVAIVLICLLTSTADGRREARERLKPYNRAAWIAVALIWGTVLIGTLWPP
jgi:hypothetical protein